MKTNELSQDRQAQALRESFENEERMAGFKFDTPEFLAAEAERKAAQRAEIRIEEAMDAHRATQRPQFYGEDAGIVMEEHSLRTPDWSENHEA